MQPFTGPSARGCRFGAHRSGRLHAACDLIAPVGTPIHAVAAGVVETAKTYFYEGTYEFSIRHPGVGVVRYGEVALGGPRITVGSQVTEGQHIAEVGRLNSGSSMLHFELYRGDLPGPLSQRSAPPYQRRGDLIDPTDLLLQWLAALGQ